MLLEDSFSMSAMFVAMGLFLVVFGMLLVEYMTNVYRNAYKRGTLKKFLIFVVLANLYVFIAQIIETQVSSILSLVHMLNVTMGIILLALFCVFMHRNFTVHRDIVRFNALLVWLTIIFAAAALGMGFIEVVVGDGVMPGDVFRVTHCLTILLFSVFGNLVVLDFIMNNREPICTIDMPRGTRLTAIGGK